MTRINYYHHSSFVARSRTTILILIGIVATFSLLDRWSDNDNDKDTDSTKPRSRTFIFPAVEAWKQCPESRGGGICPNMATCCPTGTPGISGCVPSKSEDPDGMGRCCDNHRGCPYGYSCSVNATTLEPLCLLDIPDPPDYLNAPETPQYDLCRLVPFSSDDNTTSTQQQQQQQQQRLLDIQTLHAFPIDGYNLAYYSNMGSILQYSVGNWNNTSRVNRVLIIVHGSERNADDYLCAGMSLIQQHTYNKAVNHDRNNEEEEVVSWQEQQQRRRQVRDEGSTLVIAPKFAAPSDTSDRALIDNLLIWDDHNPLIPLSHSWRYGADAANDNHSSNVSSYAAIDYLVDYLVETFPNLRKVTVAGHSAGGQLVQRWSLLSGRPFWNPSLGQHHSKLEIRAVVANPRSYCYMDGRRMVPSKKSNNVSSTSSAYSSSVFDYPSKADIDRCPSYNQWQWGLDDGGEVSCPYRDRALNEVRSSPSAMADRFARRHVHYLTGEYDVIQQKDRCEATIFQGKNRNQRSKRYFHALKEYFHDEMSDYDDIGRRQQYYDHRHDDHEYHDHHRHSDTTVTTTSSTSASTTSSLLVHTFHQVSGSPHDHTLMFQSTPGREAIFGDSDSGDGGDDGQIDIDGQEG